MRRVPHSLLWIAGTLIFSLLLLKLYFSLTDDIRIGNMVYDLPHHSEWEIPELSSEEKGQLASILDQKFYYVGKGAQSYVFSSNDNQYVVKFFKFKHLRPSWILAFLPPISPFVHYRDRVVFRKQKKLNAVFAGYHLAYGIHKAQSALVYIHLNRTEGLHSSLTATDKLGFERHMKLDEMVFIIQKRGKTTETVLAEVLNKGDLPLVKSYIRQIFDLYMSEYQKGIFDLDHGVLYNTGFLNGHAVHLDVGRLAKNESIKNPPEIQKDLIIIASALKQWVQTNYPNAYPEIVEDMETKLSECKF
jgi:hypothetical protein